LRKVSPFTSHIGTYTEMTGLLWRYFRM